MIPQVMYFAGSHDAGYVPTFDSLESEQLLGKLVVVRTPSETDTNLKLHHLPCLKADGLFMADKLPRAHKRVISLTVGPFSTVTTNGGLISPQSPARLSSRFIDPSLVSAGGAKLALYLCG